MKKIFILVLALSGFVICANGQKKKKESIIPIDSSTNRFAYDGIVKEDSISQEELYKRAKLWMVTNLKSSDKMTSIDDQSHESITGTGNLTLQTRSLMLAVIYEDAFVNFKMSIFLKNGKYRYRIENMTHSYDEKTSTGNGGHTTSSRNSNLEETAMPKRQKLYTEVNEKFLALIASLKTAMHSSALPPKADW